MTYTEYTPGPWRACRDGQCRCGHIWSTVDDVVVAKLHQDEDDKHVKQDSPAFAANARLIAAAPDLHWFADQFEYLCRDYQDDKTKFLLGLIRPLLGKIRGDT